MVHYCTAAVGDRLIFYREASHLRHAPLLLLHGLPSASHMFRNLIPLLADRFHIVALDLPGLGCAESPPRWQFEYTFDNRAKVIRAFTETIDLTRYALYVFDYGVPVGFRLALAHPERVSAIVSQNGNAYEKGLGDAGLSRDNKSPHRRKGVIPQDLPLWEILGSNATLLLLLICLGVGTRSGMGNPFQAMRARPTTSCC